MGSVNARLEYRTQSYYTTLKRWQTGETTPYARVDICSIIQKD
jgi:hypothetical protein